LIFKKKKKTSVSHSLDLKFNPFRQISQEILLKKLLEKKNMSINYNLTFLEQCKDFIERKLQNDENSQEYKEDQKKYKAYVNSNFYPLNYFKSLQLFEPIHAKVSARL
jgi:hypothetical protein